VLIDFPVGTKFQERRAGLLTAAMAEVIIPLFREACRHITFFTHEETKPSRYYTSYNLGLLFDNKDSVRQSDDFSHVELHRTARYLQGVYPTEPPPSVKLGDNTQPIGDPHVCMSVQSTTQSKCWNNPNAWREIVRFLKGSGYGTICVDQKSAHGTGLVWNHIPHGAEDQTGDRPLLERVHWIKHADFFVNFSSGLSWLAWSVGPPIVLISGFSHPTNEFETRCRVISYHACNSCWNDLQRRFDHKDFLWCSRHRNMPHQFECTRLITVEHVTKTISGLPRFRTRK
jgi:autotransporter strand-loop-strand O-heptosyltransferase